MGTSLPGPALRAKTRAAEAVATVRILTQSGIIQPYGPLTLAGLVRALVEWGPTPAGGFKTMALRAPDRTAVVDELGSLTYRELHERTNALARGLRARGVKEGDGVALMCRNHRGFVEASIAISKLGADVLYLNTAFAGPQLKEVMEREDPTTVVHDQEFTELLAATVVDDRVLAWVDDEGDDGEDGTVDRADTVGGMIEANSTDELSPPDHESRTIILTSGTTGTPKGAPRPQGGISAAVSLLSRMPLKEGWTCHVAAPLFHTWGFAHYQLSMMLGTTMVLRRKFDPENALEVLREHDCDSFAVIPVMLQRILALPEKTLDEFDLPALKAVASSGSAIPGKVAAEWMDRFGDTIYSVYGSTEVAWASIATPADLRAAPDSAGKPPHATVVKILDENGKEVPQGTSGRIFVGNDLQIEGYTGGGGKEMVDGLMSSGDVGRYGDDGRLYVEGRDDEMIVSGGENVFPKEVEDCLASHDAVSEVAAIGVDDDDFGKRLKAFVSLKDGAEASEDDLKAWVKDNLARYKVPREIVFLDELPRNATGKVLKRELVDDEDEGGGDSEGSDGGSGDGDSDGDSS